MNLRLFGSLFFKIFAAFMGAQLALALALALWALANERNFSQRFTSVASESLAVRAQAATVAFEEGGFEALRQAWDLPSYASQYQLPGRGRGPGLRRGPGPEDHSRAALYEILGEGQFERLIGPPVPPEFTAVLEQARAAGEAQLQQGRGHTLLARRVQTASGRVYLAAMPFGEGGRPPRGDLFDVFFGGPDKIAKVSLAAIVLGLICWALTRTLTAPLRRLQNAARSIARGDFRAVSLQDDAQRRDEIGDLARDMDAMRAQIESLLKNERRLRSDISHELRSPLARIGVALDLANQTADPRTARNLARIRDESQELGTLISGLLTLSRLENAAHNSDDAAYLDLAALVSHVAEKVEFEADARGVRIQILELLPLQMRGDGQLLDSALENILRNALFHAPNSPKIEISLRSESVKTALLTIRDFGPGVPEKALNEIFRPFYRVQSARDRETGGTGLGLSIAQRAVEASGGTVCARNAQDGGLRVEIRLPIWENARE